MSVKSLLIVFLVALLPLPAFADEAWVVVATDRPKYHTGEDMEVFGYVLERKMPVIAMSIYDPDGAILSANSVELQEDDSFAKTISLDSPFYDKSGIYLIELDYGKNTDALTFEVIGAAPEPEPQPLPQTKPEVVFLETDKNVYFDNEFITISGIVSEIGEPTILIGVYDQNDSPTGFYTPQISSDLEFSVSFLAKAGVNFKTDGKYYVKAHYGASKQQVEFQFAGSPQIQTPENSAETAHPQINQVRPSKNEPSAQIVPQLSAQLQVTPTRVIDDASPQVISPENNLVENSDNLTVEDQELGKMLNEITLDCDVSRYSYTILYYDGMGPALMRLCNYEQAISYFDDSLIKEPDNIEALTNKATAYAKLGDLDVAIEYYNMVLEANPDFVPALNNKANVLAQLGRFDEAISIYKSIQNQDKQVEANLQKAGEVLAQSSEKQHKQDAVIPVIGASSQTIVLETDEPSRSGSLADQIGSIFASLFGFFS
ncbi:MAG TPA: tetratricopeptide repeat protein [Candidatus Nitrosotenuis sp.]|nr:tetratricopeptide repeat protein [Candidatus Nitrosotenuis sp.]